MIWLVGNMGMLGKEISGQLRKFGLPHVESDRNVDFTDYQAIEKFAEGKNIQWIINCAAYTAVDAAENDKEFAGKLNVTGPRNLAKYSKKHNIKLIHFSTDYIFSGEKTGPYVETDTPDPQSVYGKTKLDGELAVMNETSKYFIIRITWLYGPYGKNFPSTMLKLFSEKDTINVVADQTGTTTYTLPLAVNIVEMIRSDKRNFGVFHYSDDGKTTWHEVAVEVYKRGTELGMVNREVVINAITSDQYPTPAKRPSNSLFSKDKIKKELGFKIKDWKENLYDYLYRIKNDI